MLYMVTVRTLIYSMCVSSMLTMCKSNNIALGIAQISHGMHEGLS